MTSNFRHQSRNIIDTASITWTIDHFPSTNTLIWGPYFRPSKANNTINFALGLLPNSTVQYCEDDIYVHLWHNRNATVLNLEYDVSIMNTIGEKCFTKKFYWNYNADDASYDHNRNVNYLISNVKLKANGFVQNNTITLRCDVIMYEVPVSPGNPQITEADKDVVLQDYESLLKSGKLSDVVLLVDDDGKQEFHVHKQILSARSPVFAAMFEHSETKEAQEGRVTLTDVSVEVCEQLLRYIYCGQIENLKIFALDLFVVADKYQLNHLKSLCEQSLCANFTVESVLSVLIFADMHSPVELKQKCIDYINRNSVEVRKSESWVELCKSRPELVFDLYADMSDKIKL